MLRNRREGIPTEKTPAFLSARGALSLPSETRKTPVFIDQNACASRRRGSIPLPGLSRAPQEREPVTEYREEFRSRSVPCSDFTPSCAKGKNPEARRERARQKKGNGTKGKIRLASGKKAWTAFEESRERIQDKRDFRYRNTLKE
jgi:hypothetical protein